jgi:glyceraldehyde 3-phosphate dehydrogenase
MANVAINGMGRIGRAALKIVMDTPELDVVAVNDIAEGDNIAYLIKHDSVYGRYHHDVAFSDSHLTVGDQEIRYYSERDPANLPWEELAIDLVFECVGIFTTTEKASPHLKAGARFVIISAPAKDKETPTVVHGVNSASGDTRIISCASCTTNNITPVVEIIGRRLGIKKAIMTTIHGYTSSQALVDSPQKRWARGRAAAVNIVPTTTGAAIATTKALPQYEGKFDGQALRVPVPCGSVADITFLVERSTTADEVKQILREEAQSEQYAKIVGVSEIPLVSTDIIEDPRASVIDLSLTQVVDGDLVKVLTWYDNEWGYTNQMVREAVALVGNGRG